MKLDRNKDCIYIFTDGSCNNRTNDKGGYGIVLLYKEHIKEIVGGSYSNTTSARMEIMGVLQALKSVTNKLIPIELFCDNQYVVRAIDEDWAIRWEREKQFDRLNMDLWVQVLTEYRQFPHGNVKFNWVRGHNGNEFNERCDVLASIGGKFDKIIIDNKK